MQKNKNPSFLSLFVLNVLFTALFLTGICSQPANAKETDGSRSKVTVSNIFDITNYGAVGDGTTLNTVAIQKTLDAAGEKGGTVVVPPGTYMSGTLLLRSHTTLQLQPGAVLLGSPNIEDYIHMTAGHNKDRQPYHFIVMKGVENVSITGTGKIDGNGPAFWKPFDVMPRWIHAKDRRVSPMVEISKSKNIRLNDFTLTRSPGWTLHLHDSDDILIDGIHIYNHLYSPNADGIDITGCRNVIVNNCNIVTCDDAIVLKTTADSRSLENVAVTNCIIQTSCVALKLGDESDKDMRQITFSNCVIYNSSRAVGLYSKEGGIYEDITISNIVSNTNAPFILNRPIQLMVQSGKSGPQAGVIRNVSISNFTSTTEGRILLTSERPGGIENLTLRDISLGYIYIEDPAPLAKGATSSQFPKTTIDARSAKAAVVADGVKNLVVDNLQVRWPEPTGTIPAAWQHPERIEHGGSRVIKQDYSKARQTVFSVLWGRNLQGGYIFAPLAQPSDPSLEKFNLKNSSIQVRE